MNIFQSEAKSIKDYLERHGYTSHIKADHLIVYDTIISSVHGCIVKEVFIRDFHDAIRFVTERQ